MIEDDWSKEVEKTAARYAEAIEEGLRQQQDMDMLILSATTTTGIPKRSWRGYVSAWMRKWRYRIVSAWAVVRGRADIREDWEGD